MRGGLRWELAFHAVSPHLPGDGGVRDAVWALRFGVALHSFVVERYHWGVLDVPGLAGLDEMGAVKSSHRGYIEGVVQFCLPRSWGGSD